MLWGSTIIANAASGSKRACYKGILVTNGYRFGFYTGGGHGNTKWTDPTLDFGDEFSVDYCAKIHDRMYWANSSVEDKAIADHALIACAKRVRPVTVEEAEAKINVNAAFSNLLRAKRHILTVPRRQLMDRRWNRARLMVDCYWFYRRRSESQRNEQCGFYAARYDSSGKDFATRYSDYRRTFSLDRFDKKQS